MRYLLFLIAAFIYSIQDKIMKTPIYLSMIAIFLSGAAIGISTYKLSKKYNDTVVKSVIPFKLSPMLSLPDSINPPSECGSFRGWAPQQFDSLVAAEPIKDTILLGPALKLLQINNGCRTMIICPYHQLSKT